MPSLRARPAAAPRRVLAAILLPAAAGVAVAVLLAWLLLGGGGAGGRLAVAGLAGLAVAVALAGRAGRRARSRFLVPLADRARELVARLERGGADGRPGGDGDPEATLDRLAELAESRLSALDEEREHLLTVLGSMSEGVLVTDSRGRTVLVNPLWRRLFGVVGDVEGRTALELTRQTALERMIEETLASGRGNEIEIEVARGRRRTVILTSAPLTDGAGVVVLARDLTPFLRVGEIRRDFVANVSHELKTPLSAIRGFAETLRDGALEDRDAAERFTGRILKQCERLEALLSDLLTLSRLEHPVASSDWAPVDMGEVAREAIDVVMDSAEERGLELASDLQRVPPFEGDAAALERLCINLLENAVKYNRPRGRVDVRLFEDDRMVVLEVADTGIGIPEDATERVFERFYRIDKGRSREEGGTGLGLAIVKHAAQLHGGRVEVFSELGRGSVFRLLIPPSLRPT